MRENKMGLYGIEDEYEIKHLLGYLTPEQWEDAFEFAKDTRLDRGKLAEYKEVIEKQFKIEIPIRKEILI